MKIRSYHGRFNIAGARIRQMREKQQISQEQLAERLQLLGMEINQKAISRVETGLRIVPDYELSFYAQALKTTVTDLLQEE